MELTKIFFENWLNGLKQVWLEKDLIGLKKYFSQIENYYESPFEEPVKNINGVLKLWEEIKNQEIYKLEMESVIINDNMGIAHWFFSDKSGDYDGIYQVEFNENLECIEFKQWCVEK